MSKIRHFQLSEFASRFPRLASPGIIHAGLALLLALVFAGCTSPRASSGRRFDYGHDTPAFANELAWEYHVNPVTGRMDHIPRQPAPTFSQRCFPLTLAARQFFYHARFDPAQPPLNEAGTRRLVREVLSRSARHPSPDDRKLVVPGWPDLYAFSQARPTLLKAEVGGRWRSYFQRGHWRMVFPFCRAGQAGAARELLARVRADQAPIIHLTTFPSLSINHAVLLYDVEENEKEIRFLAYDANTPTAPARLIFDRATRRFMFPRNAYFPGGPVQVYEVYRGLCY